MAEFLTTHATASSIENIILNSREKLVLLSPYLQLSPTFFHRLKDADERGVKIVIVYGKDELQPSSRSQLAKLRNLSLFFCENLHAKCYLNEDNMVITSMNMYEFSEKNNREMGILIKRQDEQSVFKAALQEVQSIVRQSVKRESGKGEIGHPAGSVRERGNIQASRLSTEKAGFRSLLTDTLGTILAGEKLDAYCIRCDERIPFDPNRPLCDECFWEWSEYGNPYYPEPYCHSCGKQRKTTKDKPLCHSCFAQLRT